MKQMFTLVTSTCPLRDRAGHGEHAGTGGGLLPDSQVDVMMIPMNRIDSDAWTSGITTAPPG